MSINTIESGHQMPETPENKLARLQAELEEVMQQLKSFSSSQALNTKALLLKSEIEELEKELNKPNN